MDISELVFKTVFPGFTSVCGGPGGCSGYVFPLDTDHQAEVHEKQSRKQN
jgi:hypothetical protein